MEKLSCIGFSCVVKVNLLVGTKVQYAQSKIFKTEKATVLNATGEQMKRQEK